MFYGNAAFSAFTEDMLSLHGKFTSVNGGNIHWNESGEGDTILLVHGFGGNLHDFNYMVAELSRNYRVVCIDRLGSR